MTGGERDLPMAPADCTLDDSGLTAQVERYHRLSTTANTITATDRELQISFSADVDLDLLKVTIEIERGCCGFFTVGYDARRTDGSRSASRTPPAATRSERCCLC